MIVSFVETMRGELRDVDGHSHRCDFYIKAEAASVRQLLKDGVTRVSGLVHAAPWASEAPAQGRLEMSVLPPRISYCVEFRSGDGEELVIEGAKMVRPAALLHSMTHLPVTLHDKGGLVLGAGELTFDLKDILPFLASWLPFPREAQRRLDVARRSVERRALAGT